MLNSDKKPERSVATMFNQGSTAGLIKNNLKPFGFTLQTLTFAVLSQTMGVVTCGKE